MKLSISNSGKNYLAEVQKVKGFFEFKLVKFNDTYAWIDIFSLCFCKQSLKERLSKYKEFKKRNFENLNGSTKFMEMEKMETLRIA